ncbi:MAG: hypothetical protein JO044_03795 [Mycobacteriaceae bacterium]|nr:hypothetical protein [Mycobacteriaceae bacterium]MBV9640180.1 hypothetical protein [Mycobacteriaceae bacterium]
MPRPTDPAARWRGAAAALLTGALAVGAHGVAGGAPEGAGVALLGVLAGTVGAVTATSRRPPGRVTLLAILALGQVIGHLVLTAGCQHHATPSGLPTAPMIAAHGLAVMAGAALIAGADRLFRALSTAVRAVGGLSEPLAATATAPVVAGDQPPQSMLLLAASVSHRGPPVFLPR